MTIEFHKFERRKDVKCMFLIPDNFNSGQLVPRHIIDRFEKQLVAIAGCFSDTGKVRGAYTMSDGSIQYDISTRYEVVLDEILAGALREVVQEMGSRLGQESMYFEITDSRVEFLEAA